MATATTSALDPPSQTAVGPTPTSHFPTHLLTHLPTRLPRTQSISIDSVILPSQMIEIAPITLDIPECTQTIVPDSNGYVPPGTCNAQYNYYPSFAAALLTAVLFGVVTFGHLAQGVMYKQAFYLVIIMGSLWEFGSFVTRTISTRYQQNSGLALVSQILVLLAPIFINAYCYTVLGRMVHFYRPSFSLLGVKLYSLTPWFVFADIACFVVQLIGGAQATATF